MERTVEKIEKTRKKHPSPLEPGTLILIIILSAMGSIVGLELITRLGTTPNTSIIGALVAIVLAQVPFAFLKKYKNVNRQNLLQTAISGSTFSAANGLMLPIGIVFLMGRSDLVWPMLIGVALAVITDATILYFSFDSQAFPAEGAWPPGIATAEAIKTAAEKGKSGIVLITGIVGGAIGKYFGIPMDILGVAFIGNAFALTAFGIGLLTRGYFPEFTGIDLMKIYLPHGVMIGAGLVALIQIIKIIKSKKDSEDGNKYNVTRSISELKKGLGRGYFVYVGIASLLAVITGLITKMSFGMFILWIIFAAIAAIISELIVGIAAMYSGWFPAFATALIFLVVGMLIGFPPIALAILVGFTASTGPAFADMAYDFKAGWVLRGGGVDPEFEREGRKQQYIAEIISFMVAILMVGFVHQFYFAQDLIPPVDRVYIATIEAGTNPEVAKYLLLWAIPGAIIQFIGGTSKQLGVLFATGLLIKSPIAGITVLVGLAIRWLVLKIKGKESQGMLYILGAGSIAGAALFSFFKSTIKLGKIK